MDSMFTWTSDLLVLFQAWTVQCIADVGKPSTELYKGRYKNDVIASTCSSNIVHVPDREIFRMSIRYHFDIQGGRPLDIECVKCPKMVPVLDVQWTSKLYPMDIRKGHKLPLYLIYVHLLGVLGGLGGFFYYSILYYTVGIRERRWSLQLFYYSYSKVTT